MSFDVNCPECKRKYAANEQMVGKRIRCRQCSHIFLVEANQSSSSSTMGRSASSVTKSPAVEGAGGSSAVVASPPRPKRTAPPAAPLAAAAPVTKYGWRESVPQPFPMSVLLEGWAPMAMGLIALIWVPAQTIGDNRSGLAWAPVVRIASFLAVYLLLVVPLTHLSIKHSFKSLRRVLPLNPLMRVATTFALPAIFAYSFSMLTGMFGFVLGCLLGLAVASVIFWLMFRLDVEEMAIPYAVAGGTFFGSALLGAFLLIGAATALNSAMVSEKSTDGIRENPLGPQFAWVVPPAPDAKPTPTTDTKSGTATDANASTPSTPTSPDAQPGSPTPPSAPDASAPVTPADPSATAAMPAGPGSSPAVQSTNNSGSTGRPAPLFEIEPGPADSDPFVVSIVNAHLPFVKTAYRPADQGIYEEAISPVTPSPFAGLIRIPGIGGRTIECCRLAPVYHGMGSLPLADEGNETSGSNGLRALTPDGTVLLRLANNVVPQVDILPFAGLGSNVLLSAPEGLAKPADGAPPAVPELLGALPGNRFLLRWNTPEHSVLQLYHYGGAEAEAPLTIRLGHSDSPGVFAVSSDGNWFGITEREADKPALALYKLTNPPSSPAMLPIETLQDTGDWEVAGIAFSRNGTKVGVLIEQGTKGAIRSWVIDGGARSAEATCTVPSANEMLGQIRGRAFHWLTNDAWLVHGRTVIDANTGSSIGALTTELVSGQQMADDRTAYLSYLGRDGHPHMAVVRFNTALLSGASGK
jgi:DNA-directed RNA polymerase subunit RPC12/RpoP